MEQIHYYNVNAIYPTYQGEQNIHGIGAPVIFIRLQGCHLRCYLKSIGTLCDTPEGLEREGGKKMSLTELMEEVYTMSVRTGIKLICLSGGDPLWRKPEDVEMLLLALTNSGLEVSVETSGTLSIEPYVHVRKVYWVLDLKLKSAAITQGFVFKDLPLLTSKDIIKLVVYDDADYAEAVSIIHYLIAENVNAKIAIGLYWGGKMRSDTLIQNLLRDNLLGKVIINMQSHKLLTHADNTDVSKTEIPAIL